MSLENDIKIWQKNSIDQLVRLYNQRNIKASGNWGEQLEGKSVIEKHRINIKILGEAYTEFILSGRGKTKSSIQNNPPLEEIIRKWIDDKGITPRGGIDKDTLAFLITRKIHREGTDQYTNPKKSRTELLNDVFTKQNTDNLIDLIRKDLVQKITANFIKVFKDGNNSN